MSKSCRTWAALASAVGETKLTLAAMVAVMKGGRGESRQAGQDEVNREGKPRKARSRGRQEIPVGVGSSQGRKEGL